MKFKARYKQANYVHGATRLKRLFAWLPLYISGYTIWLCSYDVLEVYLEKQTTVILDGKTTIFTNGKWECLSKRII